MLLHTASLDLTAENCERCDFCLKSFKIQVNAKYSELQVGSLGNILF